MTREEAKEILKCVLNWEGEYMDYLSEEEVEAVKTLAEEQKSPNEDCNNCKYYEGVHGARGHAPCKKWGIGGVMWNHGCKSFEPYKKSQGVESVKE